MKPIELHDLDTVRGGIGALLGGLAKAAGPILNGVAGIVSAAKGGGGGGGGQAQAQGPAPAQAYPTGGIGGGGGVSVSVSINGVQSSVQA